MNRSIIQLRNLSKDIGPTQVASALSENGCPEAVTADQITMVGDGLGSHIGTAMLRMGNREQANRVAEWIEANDVQAATLRIRARKSMRRVRINKQHSITPTV